MVKMVNFLLVLPEGGSIFNLTSDPLQSGPKYASGGDEANPCQYSFIWETPGACSVKPVQEKSCNVTNPESGYTYDFSSLHTTTNPYHNVTSGGEDGFRWEVTACGFLNHTCDGSNSAPVCQHADSHEYKCGEYETQSLKYFDGSLTVSYTGGRKCHHVDRNRSVLINLECDRTVYIGEPKYVQESDCEYTFEWPTALACPPRELECVAEGGKYDLRPLMETQNWEVNNGLDAGKHRILIGGCR